MSEDNLNEFSILKLSKAKDGDIVVFASDAIDDAIIDRFRQQIQPHLKVKLLMVGLPSGDSLSLVSGDEARAILKKIAEEDP